MPYGIIKVDTVTFTDNGVDKNVSLSGLVQNPTFTGNVTATGTISGDIIRGGTTVSGLTVTGTTANFASGVFTTQVSGLLITGPTVSATTGDFTSLTGTTTTGTTANFASGVFTTQVSGLLITGPTVSATTGTFTSLTGTTATFTSGIIASGTNALPSLAFLSDPDTGIFSPGANQLAVATSGVGRLFVDASGNVGVGAIQAPSWASASSTVLSIVDTAFANAAALKVVGPTTITEVGAGPSFTWAGSFSNHPYVLYTNTIERARIRADGMFEVKGAGTAGSSPAFSVNGSAPADSAVIDSSGRLGIGTSSPGDKLSVIGGDISVGEGGKLICSAGTQSYYLLSSGASEISYQGTLNFRAFNANSPKSALHLSSAGLVGIGTTSPGTLLDVALVRSSATHNTAFFGTTGTGVVNDISRILIKNVNTGSGQNFGVGIGGVLAASASNQAALAFYYDNGSATTEGARIDSSGRLLVGTTTDLTGALLQVNGAMNSNKFQQNVTAGSTDTIFTMAASQCYHIYATEGTNQTHSVAIASCAEGSSTAVLTSLYQSSANTVLSASGLNIQVYNGAGSTRTIKTTILRMA